MTDRILERIAEIIGTICRYVTSILKYIDSHPLFSYLFSILAVILFIYIIYIAIQVAWYVIIRVL